MAYFIRVLWTFFLLYCGLQLQIVGHALVRLVEDEIARALLYIAEIVLLLSLWGLVLVLTALLVQDIDGHIWLYMLYIFCLMNYPVVKGLRHYEHAQRSAAAQSVRISAEDLAAGKTSGRYWQIEGVYLGQHQRIKRHVRHTEYRGNGRVKNVKDVFFTVLPLYKVGDTSRALAYVCYHSESPYQPTEDLRNTFAEADMTTEFGKEYELCVHVLREQYGLRDAGFKTPILELVDFPAEAEKSKQQAQSWYAWTCVGILLLSMLLHSPILRVVNIVHDWLALTAMRA